MEQSGIGFGRTIQLFLVDGTPNGLAIASIHGWTGSVTVSNQPNFGKLLARPEVDRTGVYILFGQDPEDPLSMRAYIGEADSVKERINQSAAQRSFWETAAVITTSDEALTKGHVRYLEARLIAEASLAGRVKLDNGNAPEAERRRLPEADRANMEAFLSNLRVILPVIGLDMLKPKPKPQASANANVSATTEAATGSAWDAVTFEVRHRSGVTARATEQNGEFIVDEASEALRNTGYKNDIYGELKRDLVEQGVLEPIAEERYRFTRPFAFRSPSAASAVILDRNSNGRLEWKVVGSAMTYHQWQEAQALQPQTVNE